MELYKCEGKILYSRHKILVLFSQILLLLAIFFSSTFNFSSSELYGNTGYVSFTISIITFPSFFERKTFYTFYKTYLSRNLPHWSDECFVLIDNSNLQSHENVGSNNNIFIYFCINICFSQSRIVKCVPFYSYIFKR